MTAAAGGRYCVKKDEIGVRFESIQQAQPSRGPAGKTVTEIKFREILVRAPGEREYKNTLLGPLEQRGSGQLLPSHRADAEKIGNVAIAAGIIAPSS